MPFGGLLTAAIIGGVELGGERGSGRPVEDQHRDIDANYTPEQSQLQSTLGSTLENRLQNPSVDLDPLKTSAVGTINKNYAGLQDRLDQQLVGRGSGKAANWP